MTIRFLNCSLFFCGKDNSGVLFQSPVGEGPYASEITKTTCWALKPLYKIWVIATKELPTFNIKPSVLYQQKRDSRGSWCIGTDATYSLKMYFSSPFENVITIFKTHGQVLSCARRAQPEGRQCLSLTVRDMSDALDLNLICPSSDCNSLFYRLS